MNDYVGWQWDDLLPHVIESIETGEFEIMEQVTIHTNHEISEETRNLLKGIAQAELNGQYDDVAALTETLRAMGWAIALKTVNFKTQQVDLYLSKRAQ